MSPTVLAVVVGVVTFVVLAGWRSWVRQAARSRVLGQLTEAHGSATPEVSRLVDVVVARVPFRYVKALLAESDDPVVSGQAWDRCLAYVMEHGESLSAQERSILDAAQ